MTPKQASRKKKKHDGEDPPKPIPDLQWEEIPNIPPTYNQLYNQKIKIRIRSLFSLIDVNKAKRLDIEQAGVMIRAAGLFPPDLELDAWLKEVGKRGDENVWYVEKRALCDGIFEVLRQGKWKPPSVKKAVGAWLRLDTTRRGGLNPENLTDIFAQEEKEDGMNPTELKCLLKFVSESSTGELNYVNYVNQWYKTWLCNRIPRPRDRIPRRHFDDTV